MVVCKFFKQGYCKFGPRCKFEHAANAAPRFNNSDAFSTTRINNESSANLFRGGNQPKDGLPDVSEITEDGIRMDLSTEKPQWPFSSYSPVRWGTSNLLRDQDLSFEEVRTSAYQALVTNSFPAYEQSLATRASEANAQVQAILMNLSQAVKVAKDSNRPTNYRPGTSNGIQKALPNAFGPSASSTAGTSAFAGQSTNASAFGQPSQMSSAFGHNLQSSSGFGHVSASSPFAEPMQKWGITPGNSAFGSTSQPHNNVSSFAPATAFGTSTASATFGQTSSPFSKSDEATSAFGQSTNSTSTFGQSAFGQPAVPAFGTSNLPKAPITSTGANDLHPFSSDTQNASFAFKQASDGTSAVHAFNTPSQQPFSQNLGNGPPLSSAFGPAKSATAAPTDTRTHIRPHPREEATLSENAFRGNLQDLVGDYPREQDPDISDFDEEALAQFRADSFVLGKIPEKPPPRSLILDI